MKHIWDVSFNNQQSFFFFFFFLSFNLGSIQIQSTGHQVFLLPKPNDNAGGFSRIRPSYPSAEPLKSQAQPWSCVIWARPWYRLSKRRTLLVGTLPGFRGRVTLTRVPWAVSSDQLFTLWYCWLAASCPKQFPPSLVSVASMNVDD